MAFGIIYKVTNLANGKIYIGQTIKDFIKYWIGHLKVAFNSNKPRKVFYQAIRKYGPESFLFETIEFCDSKEELDEMEFHYIKQYKSLVNQNGYNIAAGGSGICLKGELNPNYGKHLSEETKKKISNSAHKNGIHYNTGKTFTEDHKEKIKYSQVGENNSFYGKKHTKDSLEKQKNSSKQENGEHFNKGRKYTKEALENYKKYQSNRPDSHNKNISSALKNIPREKRGKQYKIIYVNGKEIVIKNLSFWCHKQGININRAKAVINKQIVFDNLFKIEKI